ncbi:MAG: hypothetical protein ACJ8HU_03215 [Chthoniobacterales bacterium]
MQPPIPMFGYETALSETVPRDGCVWAVHRVIPTLHDVAEFTT